MPRRIQGKEGKEAINISQPGPGCQQNIPPIRRSHVVRSHVVRNLAALFVAIFYLAPGLSAPAFAEKPSPTATSQLARGQYIFDAAGCAGCHTNKKKSGATKTELLAGGRALKTSFGIFYGPNITPDIKTGIGAWTKQDFFRALRNGIAPDGSHYFPVFPYGSYTLMSDQDIDDLRAYIYSLPAIEKNNKPHDVSAPFGWRILVPVWKALYFSPGPSNPTLGRGAYLVRALGHCAECHTPRNQLGGFEPGMDLSGTTLGPKGGLIPNITPDADTGIGTWSAGDLKALLTMGMLPDSDFVGAGMGEVVDNTTSRLTESDIGAMIEYLRRVPAVHNRIAVAKKENASAPEPDW